MWNITIIVRIPYEGDPGYLLLVVELMQLLQEQGLILQRQVNNTQPSFLLGSTDQIPGSQGLTRGVRIPPPKALSLNSLKLLDDALRDGQTTQMIYRHRGEHRVNQ